MRDLNDNVFETIGKEWMLVTAGNEEKFNMMTYMKSKLRLSVLKAIIQTVAILIKLNMLEQLKKI